MGYVDASIAASASSGAANSGTQANGQGGSINKNTYTNSITWQAAAVIGAALIIAVILFRRKS